MTVKFALLTPIVITLLSACATVKSPETPETLATPAVAAATPAIVATSEMQKESTGLSDAADSPEQPSIEDLPRADLVAAMPETVESFERTGARAFDAGGDGVNIRYANPQKHRRADVFIYPVAENNKNLRHTDLVMGSTQATMRAIAQAVQQGVYQNLNVIDAATRPNGLRTIARVKATYLQKNLASYTLVYQTEHDGNMVKIRMTMPDNEANRESPEWDNFADQVLKAASAHFDSENAAEPEIHAAKPEINAVEPEINAAEPEVDAAEPEFLVPDQAL